jgi:hypothetical protein
MKLSAMAGPLLCQCSVSFSCNFTSFSESHYNVSLLFVVDNKKIAFDQGMRHRSLVGGCCTLSNSHRPSRRNDRVHAIRPHSLTGEEAYADIPRERIPANNPQNSHVFLPLFVDVRAMVDPSAYVDLALKALDTGKSLSTAKLLVHWLCGDLSLRKLDFSGGQTQLHPQRRFGGG